MQLSLALSSAKHVVMSRCEKLCGAFPAWSSVIEPKKGTDSENLALLLIFWGSGCAMVCCAPLSTSPMFFACRGQTLLTLFSCAEI